MLGINQLDFMSYATAFKSNYRKGIRRLEAILSNPTHAAEFAANLGGVSVVLGVPIGREDRNSDALLSLLLNSDIADDAVLTWMHQFYEFTTWDDLMGNSARVQEMMQNPFLWRALGGSKKAVGKGVATLAGLSCVSYADIDAVVASSTAMAAVIGNATALNAVVSSSTAMAAVATSQTAMAAVIGNATALNAVVSSSTAMAAVIGNATALNAVVSSSTAMAAVAASQTAMTAVATSQTAMTAIVASPTAMAAIWKSNAAVTAVKNNATAWKTFTGATSAVMGKTVAILADLNPADYADMTAVAASQTAMAAVAASKVATGAIAASATALAKIAGSTTALDALYAKKSRLTGASASKSGKFIILQISSSSAFSTSKYGYATLSDGSQPDWGSYLGKYAYFKQFKMVATFIKNDTESDDWIDYFPCG